MNRALSFSATIELLVLKREGIFTPKLRFSVSSLLFIISVAFMEISWLSFQPKVLKVLNISMFYVTFSLKPAPKA